jgi:hypothetical protein
MTNVQQSVRCGIYHHFKGNTYHVLGVARNERGEEFVSYMPQHGPYAGKLSHRPLAMFLEQVDKPDIPYEGSRFTFKKEEDFLTPLVLASIEKETGLEGASDVVIGLSENTETGQQFRLSVSMNNGSPTVLHLRRL